jgi:hypothetical protein
MPATEVTLAGGKVLLPTKSTSSVLQILTKAQIQAIPKDKYSVTLLDMPTKPVVTVVPTPLGYDRQRRQRTLRKILQGKRIARFGGGSASRMARDIITRAAHEDSATQFYTALVSKLEKAKKDAEELYMENRRNTRCGGDGDPQEENLFYEPIDKYLMSDCIIKAKTHFFGDSDRCKLHGHEFKLAEFCLFIYYYFIRINILENKARQPFSEYMRKEVLRAEKAFTDKTFNNYAKNYEKREKDFTDPDQLSINFRVKPMPDTKNPKPLLYAFQEIGHFFHKSDYFADLRKVREQMIDFDL